MTMVWIIAKRELLSLLKSPLAWIIAATVQAIIAYMFIINLDYYVGIQSRLAALDSAPGLTELVVMPTLVTAAWVLLLVLPLLTMRLFANERRQNTIALLFSSPLAMWEIVLGKYLSLTIYLLLLTLLLLLMPLSLTFGSSLDVGMLLSGIIGLLLVSLSYLALGLFIACIADSAVVSAVISIGLLLMLWLIELSLKTGESGEFISYVSMLHHFLPLMKGLFSSVDLIYYLLFIALFLLLSVKHLEFSRVQA